MHRGSSRRLIWRTTQRMNDAPMTGAANSAAEPARAPMTRATAQRNNRTMTIPQLYPGGLGTASGMTLPYRCPIDK